MKFGAVYMSVWMWIVPAIIVFYVIALKKRRKITERFISSELLSEIAGSFDARKRKVKNLILIFAIFFGVFALMRPQWGFKWQEIKRQGLDILIALDTSKSMLAEDVLPNRLERSKLAVRDLVKKLKGDRVGLIVFSGTAFLQCPLTIDYDGFLLSLDDVDVNTIPVGGTSISKVIYTAAESYEGGKKKEKILIIITDGEDLEGGIDRAIEKARLSKIKIFCAGIGSPEGEIVPVTNENGRRVFLKDAEGNIVKTKLVEEHLRNMALKTGGMYVRASGAELGLDLIYDEKLSKLEKEEFKSKMEKRYNERFQIPLALVFLLILIEPLIGDNKKGVR
ncbi:MAG: VWA domain-containing protein [Candidatus Omnitrophota bacterium]